MADNVMFSVVAAGSFGTNGASVVNRGCACARQGAGDYTITLDKGVGANDCVCLVSPRTTAELCPRRGRRF